MESKPLIQFKNCTKRYGGKTILRNISFEVDEGPAFISILGKSGCGKTTLLRLLAGLEKPEEGKISINGKIVSEGNKIIVLPHQRDIGFVFQDLALWPHFTVYQNIEFGLKQLQIAGYKNLINQTLEEFGIAELKNNFPHQLSGGQQQLVALARSMALQPRILLMDEPLANLDVKLKKQIRRLVKQLVKEKDMTVLYVTHDHKEAVDLSDKIMLLNNGIINYYGATTEMHQSNDAFVKEFIEI